MPSQMLVLLFPGLGIGVAAAPTVVPLLLIWLGAPNANGLLM